MAELVCERIDGCALFPEAKTESEYCPTCVNTEPTFELTKSTNSGNMCIEKFDECVLSASKRVGGKIVKTPGSVEVMIYQKKNKIEGGMTDIKLAAQKVYDILKNDGKTQLVDKKLIKRYNLN